MIVRRNEQVPILINILDFLFRNCILYALYIQIFVHKNSSHDLSRSSHRHSSTNSSLLRDLFRSRFDLMFRCVQLRYERNTREERCERSIMEIIPGTEWCFYLVFEAMAEREAHLLCLLLNPIGNRLRIMAPSGEANVAVYRLASVYSPPLDSIIRVLGTSRGHCQHHNSLKRCRLRPCAPSN